MAVQRTAKVELGKMLYLRSRQILASPCLYTQNVQEDWAKARSSSGCLYNDLAPRLIALVLTMLPTCLFALLTLLPHKTAAFPALGLTSISTWAEKSNPLTWRSLRHAHREPEQNLAKRQGQGDGTAFDRNPDGSAFLWVLQDTYEGETFFE